MDIGRKTKVSLFKSLVLSVLLHGCETWKLTKTEDIHLSDQKPQKNERPTDKPTWTDGQQQSKMPSPL